MIPLTTSNKHWRFVLKSAADKENNMERIVNLDLYEKLHLDSFRMDLLSISIGYSKCCQSIKTSSFVWSTSRPGSFEHSLRTQYHLTRSLHWTASHPAISRKLIASITFWLCLVWLGDLVLEFGMPRPHFLQNNVHIGRVSQVV
jgi:hypothetical protein